MIRCSVRSVFRYALDLRGAKHAPNRFSGHFQVSPNAPSPGPFGCGAWGTCDMIYDSLDQISEPFPDPEKPDTEHLTTVYLTPRLFAPRLADLIAADSLRWADSKPSIAYTWYLGFVMMFSIADSMSITETRALVN
jgi:hypothetical protein